MEKIFNNASKVTPCLNGLSLEYTQKGTNKVEIYKSLQEVVNLGCSLEILGEAPTPNGDKQIALNVRVLVPYNAVSAWTPTSVLINLKEKGDEV